MADWEASADKAPQAQANGRQAVRRRCKERAARIAAEVFRDRCGAPMACGGGQRADAGTGGVGMDGGCLVTRTAPDRAECDPATGGGAGPARGRAARDRLCSAGPAWCRRRAMPGMLPEADCRAVHLTRLRLICPTGPRRCWPRRGWRPATTSWPTASRRWRRALIRALPAASGRAAADQGHRPACLDLRRVGRVSRGGPRAPDRSRSRDNPLVAGWPATAAVPLACRGLRAAVIGAGLAGGAPGAKRCRTAASQPLAPSRRR